MTYPIKTFTTTIHAGWIDYNGHLNDANYLVIFTQATDGLQNYLGMDVENIHTDGYTLFTIESHLLYIKEVGLNAKVYVTTQVLEFDNKRLRVFHRMYNEQDELLSTVEMLFLSYHLKQKKVVPMSPSFSQNLADLMTQQNHLPWPDSAGKSIRLTRK